MSDQVSKYVLDSYALLAYFQAEAGGSIVRNLFEKALISEAVLHLSPINMGEVYYITSKKLGNSKAESVLFDIQQLPIMTALQKRLDKTRPNYTLLKRRKV